MSGKLRDGEGSCVKPASCRTERRLVRLWGEKTSHIQLFGLIWVNKWLSKFLTTLLRYYRRKEQNKITFLSLFNWVFLHLYCASQSWGSCITSCH